MPHDGYFVGRLLVEAMDDFWCVRESFTYVTSHEQHIVVPKGFLTDGASIPRVFWSRLSPFDKRYAGAAVVHDYLYFKHLMPQHEADEIFAEAVHASAALRGVLFRNVRRFGSTAYATGPERQRALRDRLRSAGLSVT